MDFNRRTYLSAMGAGILGYGAVSRRVSASSNVRVSGTIESEAGTSLEGSQVEFFSPDTHQHARSTIEDGRFEVLLEGNAAYEITFWHEDVTGGYRTAFDEVPLLYGLEADVQLGDEDTDLGTYEVPAGSEVQIRFEDMDGNPVDGLPVSFRSSTTGSGTGPGEFATNSAGYVFADDETEPGIELAGDVGVEVRPPADHDAGFQADRLAVTEDREVSIPVRDPESYGGTVVDGATGETTSESNGSGTADDSEPTTAGADESTAEPTAETPGDGTDSVEAAETSTASETHRGFLTNDPESSFAVLDDPVALTWGGIAVSIGGIVLQLFGRQ